MPSAALYLYLSIYISVKCVFVTKHDLNSGFLKCHKPCLQAKVLATAALAGYNPAVGFVCLPLTHSLSARITISEHLQPIQVS